jgi:hypothetical protein
MKIKPKVQRKKILTAIAAVLRPTQPQPQPPTARKAAHEQ